MSARPRVEDGRRLPRTIGLVRPLQLYVLVRDQLLQRIRAGEWRPGERLPPERDLARSLGVSRTSLREALAALELAGIVTTQQGSGSYVTRSGLLKAQRITERERKRTDLSPTALLEVRFAIEPAVASAAAQAGAQDEEAVELLELMAATADPADRAARNRWSEADRRFHRRIAQMSGNPLFGQISDLVYSTMNEPLWRVLRDKALGIPDRLHAGLEEHRLIYGAIVRGDAQEASRQAARHIAIVRETMDLSES